MQDQRLTAKGIEIGLIGDVRKVLYLDKFDKISQINVKNGSINYIT
jgi:tRNA uridine 5-carboxymethylaminomethyl modification enzyme